MGRGDRHGGGTHPHIAPPPQRLVASAVSSSQIELSWADNAVGESGFKIERWNEELGEYEEHHEADVTGFRDTGRALETTYRYRVRSLQRGRAFALLQ